MDLREVVEEGERPAMTPLEDKPSGEGRRGDGAAWAWRDYKSQAAERQARYRCLRTTFPSSHRVCHAGPPTSPAPSPTWGSRTFSSKFRTTRFATTELGTVQSELGPPPNPQA